MHCFDCIEYCHMAYPCERACEAYYAGCIFALLAIPLAVVMWAKVKPRPIRALRASACAACLGIIYNVCEPVVVAEPTDWTFIVPTLLLVGCLGIEVVHEFVARWRARTHPIGLPVARQVPLPRDRVGHARATSPSAVVVRG